MINSFPISTDHEGFYRDGKLFFPKIQSDCFPIRNWSDAVLIRLPASLKDDLDWSIETKIAEEVIKKNKLVFWELDFQFHLSGLSHFDTAAFFAHVRALEEFIKCFSPFFQQTFAICLYRGNTRFFSLLKQQEWNERFYEWLTELVDQSSKDHELKKETIYQELEWINTPIGQSYFHLFSADILADYLHRLISFLPEGLLPTAFFDLKTIDSDGRIAQLFSKERFAHLCLGFEAARSPFDGMIIQEGILSNPNFRFFSSESISFFEKANEQDCEMIPEIGLKPDISISRGWLGNKNCLAPKHHDLPNLAICLPSDPYCDTSILLKLDRLINKCHLKNLNFRMICEERLTDEWNGLDHLVIIPESISPKGTRKLQGFQAAGGEVITNLDEIP